MKNIFALALLLVFGFVSKAQITLDQNDMPIAGDSTIRHDATGFNALDFTTSGASQTWDYTSLVPSTATTKKYFNISGCPLFAQLYFGLLAPSNTKSQIFSDGASPLNFGNIPLISTLFSTSGTFEYFKKNSTRYARTGYTVLLNGIDIPLPYDSNDIFYRLPINYGNADSAISIFEINTALLSFLYYRTVQNRVNHVDGWGKLKLPNGFDYDVLRVKSELYAVDTFHVDTTIAGFPISQGFTLPRPKTIEYKWLTKGMQSPILEAIGTEIAGTFTPTSVKFLFKEAVAINNKEIKNSINLYPNPACNQLLLECIDSKLINLEISDLLGRPIIAKHNLEKQNIISIVDLCKGQYNCKIVLENGVVVNKMFIKE